MTPDQTGFLPNFPINEIKGAEYNPRRIDDDALIRLQESLGALGCCKPIIVRNQTIVAGHQRTKALRAMGLTHAPVYMLGAETNLADEVTFNQLHNGTDMDLGDEACTVPAQPDTEGYVQIEAKFIKGNMRATGAPIRGEIMRLISKYGPWGACVAKKDGTVIHAAQYALACKATNLPLLVYILREDQIEVAKKYLPASYGEFCYDGLKRETYIQSFAQPYRMRKSDTQSRSYTYDDHVIPWMEKNKGARVLDFGCGQGDYVKHLQALGYNIIGMELFRRLRDKEELDIRSVNLMADGLCRSLTKFGRFDAVLIDYVLNSVDSQQAEDDVLLTIKSFCKTGGRLFYSGRTSEAVDKRMQVTRWGSLGRGLEVRDKTGLTGILHHGQWFYQKYHGEKEVRAFSEKHGFDIQHFEVRPEHQWRTVAINKKSTIAEMSLTREFDMKMGIAGHTLGRHNDVINALKTCTD